MASIANTNNEVRARVYLLEKLYSLQPIFNEEPNGAVENLLASPLKLPHTNSSSTQQKDKVHSFACMTKLS